MAAPRPNPMAAPQPDPMSALRFLQEEGAMRNVSVTRLVAFWEGKINTQSQGCAVKVEQKEHRPCRDYSECERNPMMTLTWSQQQQDLMTKATKEALKSTCLNNLIVCAMQNVVGQQEGSVSDMIGKALQLAWNPAHSTGFVGIVEPLAAAIGEDDTKSVTQNEVPFRQIDGVILLGINDMLPSGQLNDFLMGTIKELLASGRLDSILQGAVRDMLLSKHEDQSVMAAISRAVVSRQLDGILQDIFVELMSFGELDDTFVSAISEVLQSGKWDGLISNNIAQLENEFIEITHDGFPKTSFEKMLYDLMVEVTFPSCAIVPVPDGSVRENLSQLSQLASGEAYHNVDNGALIAGSSVEGLSIFPAWGHPWSDIDFMYLYGAWLGVSVPTRSQPGSDIPRGSLASPLRTQRRYFGKKYGYIMCPYGYAASCLEYAPEDCPPAYTRLRVTRKEGLLGFPIMKSDCIEQDSDGQYWLHIVNMQKVMQRKLNANTTNPEYLTTSISGPAGEIIASNGSFDIVPTFVASGPHPAILDYIHRPRGEWPPQDQLQELQQLPMCLVLVGHKESQYYRQLARVSWSPGEIILISNLPTVIKQGFIVSKCTLKYFLKVYEDQNPTDSGRSKVGSYHLKTTFLHYLEKEPPKKITSPFVLMINLLHDLRKYVANAKLPHYFLPECNLLGSVGPIQRQIALKAIQTILADPAAAIIKCPSKPKEIYIDIPPDDLLAAFRGLFDDPNSIGCLEVLMMYMFRLDSWREARYRLQQERDVQENSRISNRPKLIKLSDMLGERIEQM